MSSQLGYGMPCPNQNNPTPLTWDATMKRLWICTLFLITSLAMVSGQEKTGVVEGYYPAWE